MKEQGHLLPITVSFPDRGDHVSDDHGADHIGHGDSHNSDRGGDYVGDDFVCGIDDRLCDNNCDNGDDHDDDNGDNL